MPRRLRIQFPDAYYHVFNRGVNKGEIFFNDSDRWVFLKILGNAALKLKLRIFSYCLMDNHFHIFLRITAPNLDRFMQMLQGRYAQYVNLRYMRVGSFFQGRYKSRLVEADTYSLTLVRYIHQNPVVSGTRQSLEDFSWSSYSCYTGKNQTWDWLDTDWILSQFNEDREVALHLFKQFHEVSKGSDPSDPFVEIGV